MTLITAHSGSDQTLENSIEFVKFFSSEKQISGIEVDVRLDSNNQLVLSHDALVNEMTYLPLSEVFNFLKQTNSHLLINCDLKEKNLEELVFELATTYNLWSKVQLSGTVSTIFLRKWPKQILMNIENASNLKNANLEELVLEENLLKALIELKTQGAEIINLNYQLFTDAIFEKGQELGVVYSLWTVNEFELIEKYQNKEVFNVTSRQAFSYINQRKEVLNEVS